MNLKEVLKSDEEIDKYLATVEIDDFKQDISSTLKEASDSTLFSFLKTFSAELKHYYSLMPEGNLRKLILSDVTYILEKILNRK